MNTESRPTVHGTARLRADEVIHAWGSVADTGIVPGASGSARTRENPSSAHRFAGVASRGAAVALCGGGPSEGGRATRRI
ncbi:hypothetical protein [Nocardia asiatica]|uniref:hypothetical protein n=1 Tax=Nocardia asiatica TaxID=209252 RepID=UPI003EDED944